LLHAESSSALLSSARRHVAAATMQANKEEESYQSSNMKVKETLESHTVDEIIGPPARLLKGNSQIELYRLAEGACTTFRFAAQSSYLLAPIAVTHKATRRLTMSVVIGSKAGKQAKPNKIELKRNLLSCVTF